MNDAMSAGGPVHYTPSGKFNPLLLALGLIGGGIIIFLLSYVYAFILYINPLVYLSVLVFAGYCFVLAMISGMLIPMVKIRNITVAMLFGALVGLIGLYSSWAVFINQLSDGALGVIDVMLDPLFMWELSGEIGNDGYYSISGATISGFFLWAIWIIEAIGLIGVPVFVAREHATTTVFCENCDRWADEDEEMLVFVHEAPESVVQKFESQDMSFLDDAMPAGTLDAGFFRVDSEWCKECNQLHTLSLRVATRSLDDKGNLKTDTSTLHEDMLVTKQTFDTAVAAKDRLGEFVNDEELVEELAEQDESK